eukprot:Nk52_evm6s217 gene=Nk52_evmTU6s217
MGGDGQEFKLVMLGDGGVGKSALTVQFVHNQFFAEYNPTVEDSYRKKMTLQDGKGANLNVCLEIIDTAGQEEYKAMRDTYMKTGQGFLIIYSIESITSFNEVDQFRRHILRSHDLDESGYFPIILVGNKCDLPQPMREVSTEQGKEKAKQWKCPFFETSAKKSLRVNDIFEQCTREVMKNVEQKGGGGGGGGAKKSSGGKGGGSSSGEKKKGCVIL